MEKALCKNCHAELHGDYCSKCGEKRIEDSDFTLGSIFGQAIGSITNFDSKLFKTFKLLLFFPGALTRKYTEGIRVPYMKPFQVFVVSNILFFIFLSETDLFRTPSQWFFIEEFDGIRVLDKVRQISDKTGLAKTEIAFKYDSRSSNLAKGLIFLLVPFIALAIKLLIPRRSIPFGKHIIFSTHYFSFVLLLCVIVSQIIKLTIEDFNKWLFIIPITVLTTVYLILGFKSYYKINWIAAILKGMIGVMSIMILIQFYRMYINIISLNTL